MVDISKIKSLKEKSKGRRPKSNIKLLIFVLVVIIVAGVLAIIVPDIIKTIQLEKETKLKLEIETLNKAKESAKQTINNLFKNFPNDPMKNVFLSKIDSAKSVDEINKIIDEAKKYVELKQLKEKLINNIKNIYGKYYQISPLAQEVIIKIQNAQTSEEASKIFERYINEMYNDAKTYYINDLKNQVSGAKYVRVDINGIKELYTYNEFISVLNTYGLETLKSIKVYKVTLVEIPLLIKADKCGLLPKDGEKIIIVDKNNKNTTIYGFVKEAFVVTPKSISYSESKSVSSEVNYDGTTLNSQSKNEQISYSLNNLDNILQAAIIGKVNYNLVISKLRDYGYRLNRISESTQLFNKDTEYLLIVSVPNDEINNILKIPSDNLYIIKPESE
ncbi:DUF515 domain-containing protein [Methanocaldococcus indicus]|uniref:DUF515 domain-containing protein n=1 Tax=Methanocaldococcus indicus TaxID=213231 RepID=UPI003C6DACF5